jgi:hypothetical protein
MKIIESDRGKTMKAPLRWVDFVVTNPDIMAGVSRSFLRAKKVGEGKFRLAIFGVDILVEEVHHTLDETQGSCKSSASIRLPWGLGNTHTITKFTYIAVDEHTTALELSITIELTTLLMRLYASLIRDRIDRYLNRLCMNIETVARMLSEQEAQGVTGLDQDQQKRIEEFRRTASRKSHTQFLRKSESDTQILRKLEGAMRVVMSESSMLVAAEVRMPDQRILSANGRCSFTPQEKEALLSGMLRLAAINNGALRIRGVTSEATATVDFRQAALEYGYQFFRKVCSEQLLTVVPLITSQGQSAYLRLTVEGEAEQLPWEVMHDGQEFICIKTCFSRSVTTIHQETKTAHDWESSGILVVGADSRGDLPGVELETKGIGRVLATAGVQQVELLSGSKANRKNVVRALQSGQFGILHYSGHSLFDREYPNQSSLELCSGTKIFLHELGHFGRAANQDAPLGLVFLNSCQSAMVGHDAVTGRQLSMCKALREAGVSYVIGMLWNVEDEAAVQMGASFYNHLLKCPEKGPDSAMRETRLAVAIERSWSDGSWLSPVLYS